MGPLEGVQVVEGASYLSGPMAGMILADLGADVVKVEPPRGDPYRRVGVPYGDSSLQFKATNQNKRSVALDLKSEDGRAELFSMLAEADVFITNWRPGVAEQLGLTAEGLRERFPRLIWARVSGYGQTGPNAGLPAFDGIIQARSGGLLEGADVPFNTNSNIADKVSAMFAAQTITAALFERENTGHGAVVDLAMVDAMAYFYGADISSGYRMVGREPDLRVGRNLSSSFDLPTADGYLTLQPITGKQIRTCLETAGVGDRFGEVMEAERSKTFRTFAAIIGPVLLTKSADEWERLFSDADIPAARVRHFDEHIVDDQMVHNGTYRQIDEPSLEGPWLQVRFPGLFDGNPARTDGNPAPALPASGSDD